MLARTWIRPCLPFFKKELYFINNLQQNGQLIAGRKSSFRYNKGSLISTHLNTKRKAILTYAYIINRISSCVLESISPMQVLSQFYPDHGAKINLTPSQCSKTRTRRPSRRQAPPNRTKKLDGQPRRKGRLGRPRRAQGFFGF